MSERAFWWTVILALLACFWLTLLAVIGLIPAPAGPEVVP